MSQPMNKNATSRQVEMIVRQLTSLSTFPQVAGSILGHLGDIPANLEVLTEFIESDPAMSSRLLSVGAANSLINGRPFHMDQLLQGLSPQRLRDAILSVRVLQPQELQSSDEISGSLSREDLAIHSLAVACGARELAEMILPEPQRHIAFSAGLLHDLGKLALLEVMPKSYLRIVAQSQTDSLVLTRMEQQHLGLDHTTVGKRLAEKWNLPSAIQAAIWLHHTDPLSLDDQVDHCRLVQIVHLADLLARREGIGTSGNPAPADGIESLADRLRLSVNQLVRVTDRMKEQTRFKSKLLGFEAEQAENQYYRVLQETASALACDNVDLLESHHRSCEMDRQLELQTGFLKRFKPGDSYEQIAFHLATSIYQFTSAAVCVVLEPNIEENLVCCFALDRNGKEYTSLLGVASGKPVVPSCLQKDFRVTAIDPDADWLIDKLEGRVNPAICLMAPLLNEGTVRGLLLFEAMSPAEDLANWLSPLCQIASVILSAAVITEQQRMLSERFAEVLGHLRETRQQLADKEILEGIAEMAAGAAHEMNNPLSVISGRAQVLASEEADPGKKEMLHQIQDRAQELNGIIGQVLMYARPQQAHRHVIPLVELIRQALGQVRQSLHPQKPECTIDPLESLANVYVDQQQITDAISQILLNAFQSYGPELGPVRISPVQGVRASNSVGFVIQDQGCGMESPVLHRALQPFFSSCRAGRRRGMGLALANRWIRLNGGRISLASQPGQGTSVTVILPCA